MSWDNFKNQSINNQNQTSAQSGWGNFVAATNPQILINQQKKIDKFHQGMSQTFKSAMQAKREEELRQQQIRLQNTPAYTGKQGQSLSYNQTNSQYLTRKTEQGYKDPYLQQRNLERIEYEKADTKVAERVLSNPNITREKKAMAEAVMHLNKKVDRGDKDWRIPSFGIANFVDDLTRQGVGIFTGSGQGSMDISARYEHSDPEMRDLQAEYDALIQKQRLVNPHNPFVGFTLGLLSSGSYMIERTLAESAGWLGRSLFVLTRGVDDINERNNQFVNYDIKTNSYVVNEENIKRTNERLSNPKKLAKDLGITIGNASLQYAVESLLGQVVGGVIGWIGKKVGSTPVGQMGLARLKTSFLGKTIDKLAETKFKLAPDKSVLDVIKNFKSLAGQQGILGEHAEEEVQFVLDEITDSLINETKYEFSAMSNEERIMSVLSVGVMQLVPVAGVKVFNDFSIRRIEKQVAKELKDNGYPPEKSEQTAKILVQLAIKAKKQEAEQKQQQANNIPPDDDGTSGATGAVQQQQEQQITPQPQQQVTQPIQQPQNQTEVITPQETTQKTQKGENKPVKQETKVETSKNKKQIEQENQIFFKPEKKESRKGVKEEGSKRDIHYIKDTATGEVSRVEIATSKKTGEVTLERYVLKEDGTEYLSDMAQLKDLEAKHETKSLQDLVRLFSGYKTLIGDSSEFIKNPNKAQKAETSPTKPKDQISDKEQGVSVKQKDKPKKKDVLPKKVIVGKVQPQTKQATKAKTEAKPTPKKKVKKQLSEKRIKELTKQNKDNAEMAKEEIERLKAKKSLTENEKATLKAYEETLKQSKKNLKELKKMEEQVKEEVKQEVKQETKPEQEVDPYAKPAFLRNKETDAGKFSEGVSTVEKRAVERYTGIGYKTINKALRNGKEKGLPLDDRNAIKSLDKVIEKYILEEKTTVYRSGGKTEVQLLANAKPDDIAEMPAFTSTSFSLDFVKKFSTMGKGNLIYEIDIPAGKGLGVNINQVFKYHENEQEFLLKRGSQVIIKEVGTINIGGKSIPYVKGELNVKSEDGQTKKGELPQGLRKEADRGNRNEDSGSSKQKGDGAKETKQEVKQETKQETKAPKASKETQVKNPKAGASYGGFAIKQDHNWSDAKDIAELKKRASNYKTRIKTPELIAFSQILGADPTLSSKLTKKLGVFWHNDGEKGIKINKAIVNDPLLLNMVLSHEIGHLIDWLPTGFIKRSSLLTKVMTDKAQMKDMFNRVLTNKEVKEELKKLTQKRNPFDESKNENYTKYRYSAAELYAEFISELLTNPEGVKQIAPKFDKLWLENIYKKPSVQQAYLNMLNLGATGEYLQVRSENVRKTAAQAEIERENVLAAAKEKNKDILTTLAVALLRKDSAVRRDYKKAKKQSSDPSAVSNPIHALENLGHKSNIINGFKEKFIRPLSNFMNENKLDINILHEFAMYDRIIHERGAVTNPAQLAMERMGDENWSKIEKYLPEDIFEMSATEQYATFKRVLGEKLYKDLMGYLPKDGGIANPFGFDHDSAKESRKYLEQSLGNDYVKYQEALRQVREFNKEVIEYAKKGGFYTPETIAMMEANPAYASFQVIDYVGTKLTAAVKHQSGTFKGIANTIFSTFEKNLSIINAVEINNAKQELVKFYQESLPEDIKELGFRMGANKQKIFDKVSNSNLYGEIILYDNGVQKAYQVDKLVADIFTYNQSPVSTNFVLNSLRFMAKIPRAAFINFNIGFQISNFFFRDFQRYYRNNPFTSAFSPLKLPRQLKNYLKAIPTAYRIVKGENNATIEEMRKARVIIEDSIFNLETRLKEIPDSRVKMQKAFEARFGMENSKDANLLVKMFAPFFNAFTATGEIAETIPKVAGYLEYQDYKKRLGSKAKFNDQEAFAIIRNRLGSPNYQNKAGINSEASAIMLFYNAIKEGILSDIEAVMDKKTRVNTLVNIGVLLLPAIYNIMQGMGEMGDEDKELMDSISEYDKRNYNILLLGRAKNGKAIYLRLPLSDSERTLRAIAYEMASKGEGDDFHDYVKSMSSVFTTVTEAVPGFNPVLKGLFDTKTYLSGENIWDSFYQDTVFTEEEMAVGGEQKLMKFLKYIRKNMGGNLVMSKSEKTVGEKEPIQKIVEEKVLFGILGRFLRYTSSGEDETLRNLSEKQEQEQLRQTAREKQAVKQEVARYKAGELTLNEAKKQAVKQVLGDDLNVSNLNEEQKKTLKRVEDRFLRESVADKYEKKLKAVYYTSKKEAKLKVLLKAMEKMSKEEVREMLKEGTRTGLISQPVSDEAWREFNKQSQ